MNATRTARGEPGLTRRALRLLPVLVGACTLAAVAVLAAGAGGSHLALPPLQPSGWTDALQGRHGLDVAGTVAKAVVVLCAGWVSVACALHAVAVLVSPRRWMHRTRRLLPGVLAGAVGAIVLAPTAGAVGDPVGSGNGATMVVIDDDGGGSVRVPTAPAEPGGPSHRGTPGGWVRGPVGQAGRDTAQRVTAVSDPTPEPRSDEVVPETEPGGVVQPRHVTEQVGSLRHVVQPGDHFWSIAARRVAMAHGGDRAPTSEVRSYWRELVRANRDRLVEPGNPDLLHPGQEIVLPG